MFFILIPCRLITAGVRMAPSYASSTSGAPSGAGSDAPNPDRTAPSTSAGEIALPSAPEPLYRFFARLVAFDLQCPGCGEVYSIGRRRGRSEQLGRKLKPLWDSRFSLFICQTCNRRYTLGIIAHPAGRKRDLPPDQAPTAIQAEELRGRLAERRIRKGEAGNQRE